MKLGIMSDSHGRVMRVRRALVLLDEAGAELFVHCGDLGGLDVLEELAGRPCRFVWGNCDYPESHWQAYVEELGLPWPEVPATFTAAGKSIAVFHGHEPGFRVALREGRYDLLLHGHTHQRADYREGSMRVINPGALQRASRYTVAVLDLGTDEVEFFEVG